MSFFIADAVAQAEGVAASGDAPFNINLIVLPALFVLMYFLLIRPQKKKQKEHDELTSSVSKGDEVVMTSGILGKVTDVGEVYLTLDVGSDVKLKFQKMAIHAVLPKGTIKSV